MKSLQSFFIYLVLFTLIIGCDSSDTESVVEPLEQQYFVEALEIRTLTADDVRNNTALLSFVEPSFGFLNEYIDQMQNNITAYNVTYLTTYLDGSTIEASGLIILPETNTPKGILSYQHGTITEDSDAPSTFTTTSESLLFSLPLASLGYVVIAPDYIGYGASNEFEHPYEHSASMASASRDLLRAAEEFLAQEQKVVEGKLFLAGYSQGGSATMAFHRLLEQENEFEVTVSMPGAGAYNKLGFTQYILEQTEPFAFIDFYVWVLVAYNDIYELNRPKNFYFTEPSATYIEATPPNRLNADLLDKNATTLFTTQFREGIVNGTDTEFIQVLEDNNTFDWTPQAPVVLFHGTADDFVPIFNAENAFEAMQANGATITLNRIEGGDHFSSIAPYFEGVLEVVEGF